MELCHRWLRLLKICTKKIVGKIRDADIIIVSSGGSVAYMEKWGKVVGLGVRIST